MAWSSCYASSWTRARSWSHDRGLWCGGGLDRRSLERRRAPLGLIMENLTETARVTARVWHLLLCPYIVYIQ